MTKTFRVGDWVTLPAPFSEITGRVIGVHGSGSKALITVEYPLDEGSSETLNKIFVAPQLHWRAWHTPQQGTVEAVLVGSTREKPTETINLAQVQSRDFAPGRAHLAQKPGEASRADRGVSGLTTRTPQSHLG